MEDLFKPSSADTRTACAATRWDDGVGPRSNQGFVDILELEGTPEKQRWQRLKDLMINVGREGSTREAFQNDGAERNDIFNSERLNVTTSGSCTTRFIVEDPASHAKFVEAIGPRCDFDQAGQPIWPASATCCGLSSTTCPTSSIRRTRTPGLSSRTKRWPSSWAPPTTDDMLGKDGLRFLTRGKWPAAITPTTAP